MDFLKNVCKLFTALLFFLFPNQEHYEVVTLNQKDQTLNVERFTTLRRKIELTCNVVLGDLYPKNEVWIEEFCNSILPPPKHCNIHVDLCESKVHSHSVEIS